MRTHFCTIGLAVCLAAACTSNEAAGRNALASSSPAATSADSTASPVATAGSADASRPDAAAAAPAWREVTIPAGTTLPVILDTSVSSATSRVEQPVAAHLSRAITIDGVAAVPQGSRISGVVTDATRSGRVKGRAHIGLRFDSLTPRGSEERYTIATTSVGRTAPATKKNDAVKIGAPAAGGAIIGAIAGGKKGALIGTAVGGGAGTGVVLSTRGKEVGLAKGAAITLKLVEPLTVRIRA